MLSETSTPKEKVVGLLGGMGPEATINIFEKIVKATHAESDTDHLRVIIDNNPKMPSRQEAILKGGKSPGLEMGLTAKNLEKAGADFIIICANTAHYFYDDVKKAVDIDVLHIIEETVRETKQTNSNIKKVGVLATNGAMKAGIFQQSFSARGIEVIEVPETYQNQIQDAIFSYKFKGKNLVNTQKIIEVANLLIQKGAEAIIMGCTEIPMMLTNETFSIPFIDPNEVIAEVAVKYAKGIG